MNLSTAYAELGTHSHIELTYIAQNSAYEALGVRYMFPVKWVDLCKTLIRGLVVLTVAFIKVEIQACGKLIF